MHAFETTHGRLWRWTLATVLLVAACGVAAGPVAAECDGPYPSFRAALPTAQQVVIGDVIAVRKGGGWDPAKGSGEASRFTLKVLYVPRGTAPARMEVVDLPTQPCASEVLVRKGDRVALLFDGTDFTPAVTVNVAAWIRGTPQDFPGVETTTVAEVYRLLGLDPPDTSTAPLVPTDHPDHWLVRVITAASIGLLMAWLLLAQRGRRRTA